MMKKYCIWLTLLLLCICAGCDGNFPSLTEPSEEYSPRETASTSVKPSDTSAVIGPTIPTTEPDWQPQLNLLGLPMLSQERMALIEYYGLINGMLGDAWPKFRDVGPGRDGIRYYGSFCVSNEMGETVYDILYVPYPDIPIATQINLQGHVFYSRYAFALYAFSFRPYSGNGIGYRTGSFYPLWTFLSADAENDDTGLDAYVLSTAAELHRRYENAVDDGKYQSPPVGEEYERLSVESAWLLCTGQVERNSRHYRYYGKFQGIDVFYKANSGIPEGDTAIGNEVFTGSNYSLIVQISHTFYQLQEAYALGLVNDEVLAQIAEAHNRYE